MGNISIQPIHRGQYLNEIVQLSEEYHFASRYLLESIINCRWKSDPPVDDVVGFVLLDDEALCGFVVCSKSVRRMGGEDVVVSAGSSALVREDYRSYSMKLLLKVFAEGDLALDLTPTDETYQFLMAPIFKCKQLDTAALAFSRFRLCFQKRLKATVVPEEILAAAPKAERALIADNMGYHGRFCTVYVENQPITILCRVFTKAKLVKIADILYISNRTLFASQPEAVMAALCRKLGTLFCWCDSRFIPQFALPDTLIERSALFRRPLATLFGRYTAIRRNSIYRVVTQKAKNVTPEEIDSLYSEKIMM